LDTLRFSALFGGFGPTDTIYLRLIGKHVVDFLVVLIELFSLVIMAEARLAYIKLEQSHGLLATAT